jgi:hypothetical protein
MKPASAALIREPRYVQARGKFMNVVEQIKSHSLYAFAVLLIPIIVGVWYLSEALRVNPKKEQIELLKEQVTPLKEQVAALKEQVAVLSQKNRELNGLVAKKEQKPSGNPEVAKSPVEETKEEETKEAENFKFRLQSCVFFRGDVTCNFIVSTTSDVQLFLLRETRLFDNFGGEYKLAKALIANKEWERDPRGSLSREMISDVPVEIRLIFLGLPEEATRVTKLIVAAHKWTSSWGGRNFSIDFQNITLSRR